MRASTLLPAEWPISDAILSRLGDQAGQQRIVAEDGEILLILHRVPKADDSAERDPAFFWRDASDHWHSSPTEGGMDALEDHVDGYRKVIDFLDKRLDEAKRAEDYFEILQGAVPVLRATRHLLEVLQAARKEERDDRRLLLLRDRVAGLDRSIDLLHSDAKSGMDFVMAVSASRQAETSHAATLEARRLNLLVAFFFPLMTLVGLFGMNAPREMFGYPGWWIVLVAGACLGFVVKGLISRKK